MASSTIAELNCTMGVLLLTLVTVLMASTCRSTLQDIVGEGEYFLGILPDGSGLVHPIAREERWPMNLGREILADLAGAPERADWKKCPAATPELELENTEKFKALLKPYDVMGAAA